MLTTKQKDKIDKKKVEPSANVKTIGEKNKEKTNKIWWFKEKSVSLQSK